MKKRAPVKSRELTARELIEKELIIFVLAHTNTLGEATVYLKMNRSTLRSRRDDYDLPTPRRNSYGGPKLTQQQMADGFLAHLVAKASLIQPAAPLSNATFVPPPCPNPLPPDSTSPPRNAA